MSTQVNSRWRSAFLIAIALLVLAFGLTIHYYRERELDRINQAAKDSILFKDSRAMVTNYIRIADEAKARAKSSELARADERAYHARKEQAYVLKIKSLLEERAAVNTSSASTQELDSIQLALYGPSGGDSVHTIPLDYSRKLTGDALRLPIEQRMATLATERLDSATAHYTRMEGSYEADLKNASIERELARETVDSLMGNAEKMQGIINRMDNPWSFGFHAGYGATISGGRAYAGPQAGIGINYWIRFKRRKK
jgi:hypothetical protein